MGLTGAYPVYDAIYRDLQGRERLVIDHPHQTKGYFCFILFVASKSLLTVNYVRVKQVEQFCRLSWKAR